MIYFQILLAVTSGAVLLEGVLSCLDGFSTSEWNDKNRVGAFRTDADRDPVLVTIMEDFVFTCSGTIRQWQLQWSHRNTRPGCTVRFHFYVLRYSRSYIRQFGPNTLSVQINTNNESLVESILDVPSNRRIAVQANDFINIIVELTRSCGSSRFYILSKQYAENAVYYKHFGTVSDGQRQTQLRYSSSGNQRSRSSRSDSGSGSRVIITQFEEERDVIPYVTAIMEGDLIEDTSTATTHLTTKKRNSPSRTISMNSIASIPGASSTQMRDSQTANIAPALTSTSTNTVSTNTVRGSGAPESIYILIGAAIAGLLMLGITITTLVLCVWQCKKTKDVQKLLALQQHYQIEFPTHAAPFKRPRLDTPPPIANAGAGDVIYDIADNLLRSTT